ncbi:hypothetical protein RI367_004051 [Sorochytrium milnesiophthora]
MNNDAVVAYGGYVVLFAGAAIALWSRYHSSGKLRLPPPAPKCYPVVGHLPFVLRCTDYAAEFDALQRTDPDTPLPDMATLHFGPTIEVILNSRNAIQEAFLGNAKSFANRYQSYLLDRIYEEVNFILSAPYGDHWRRIRNAMHKVLTPKQVLGGMNLESETRVFLQETWRVQQLNGSVSVKPITQFLAFNVIFSTTFGRRFESLDDRELHEWLSAVDEVLFAGGQITLHDLLPFLRKLPLPQWMLAGYYERRTMSNLQSLVDRIMAEMSRLRSELKDTAATHPPSHIRDLLAMQEEMKLSDRDIAAVAFSMIAGATETSSTALQWLVGELVNRPELQQRAYAELHAVCQQHQRLPELNDRLPFCYALIKETLRRHPSADVVARRTVEPVTVCGYDIPANTNVIASLISSYGSGVDAEFNPDRWLGDSQGADGQLGDFLKGIFSFGGGRRICPGINLAYQELFMALTRLLATFELQPPPGVDKINLVPRVGITVPPAEYSISVKPRESSKWFDLQ